MKKILLIQPPFFYGHFPSAPLSSLKALLEQEDFEAEVIYANLLFKALVSFAEYEHLSTRYKYLDYTEFLFAPAAFPAAFDKHAEYLEILKKKDETLFNRFYPVQEKIPDFLDSLSRIIIEKAPDLVFINCAFKQVSAALAITGKLKEKAPGLITVLGGYGCLEPMGEALEKIVTSVDYFLAGENEFVFLELAGNLLTGKEKQGQNEQQQQTQQTGASKVIKCPPLEDLDRLPYPDFTDYFQTLDLLWMSRMPRRISIETSRGCWWGAKSHCIFCGHHHDHIVYHKKSAPRARKELEYLIDRYDPKGIVSRDAIIPGEYYEEVFKKELSLGRVREIFYEVKPGISFEKVQILAKSRIRVQAGIESFNDSLLKQLGKGLTAAQNILFLKKCRKAGVRVFWNFLYAIPGESEDEYREMIEHILPFLTHFEPPANVRPLVIQRFSPLFDKAGSFGIKKVRPIDVYNYIYPDGAPLDDLAFYFEGEYSTAFENSRLKEAFWDILEKWSLLWQQDTKPEIRTGQDSSRRRTVTDCRQPANPVVRTLSSLHWSLLEEYDNIAGDYKTSREFKELLEWGLIIKTGKKYISVVSGTSD